MLFGTLYLTCWAAIDDRTPKDLVIAPIFLIYLPFFLIVFAPYLLPSLLVYLGAVRWFPHRAFAVALGPVSGVGAVVAPGLDYDTRIYDSPGLAIGILLGGAVYGRFVRLVSDT